MSIPHQPSGSSASDSGMIAKVRKLLAMAEGSPNPNEADAFSRKAAELIAAHRIDPDRLQATADDDLAVSEFVLGRGAYVRGRLGLLQAVAEAHGCRVVFEVRERGTRPDRQVGRAVGGFGPRLVTKLTEWSLSDTNSAVGQGTDT